MKAIIAIAFALIGATEALRVSHKGSSAEYYFDEGPNGNQCNTDDDCDGLRTCSDWGWCQGYSR